MKTMRLVWIPPVVGLLLLAGTGGCAARHEISVDSMAAPTFKARSAQSYVIRAKPQGAEAAGELREGEAVEHVRTALSAQGLWEAPSADQADLVVEVEYGIDPARVRYDLVSTPLYGRPGPDISVRQYPNPRAPEVTSEGAGLPTRQLGEFEEVIVPVTIREKHLVVSGRENRPVVEGRPPPEVFRVSASLEDESSDLRGSLPLLASVVMDQLGQPTEGNVTTVVQEDGAAVVFIRRGM